jgi:hypothetical protein
MLRINRVALMALATFALTATAHAGNVQDAATKYEVPTIEYKKLTVFGNDLLHYDNSGGELSLGSDFMMVKQNAEVAYSVWNSLGINVTFPSEGDGSHAIDDNLGALYRQYFTGSRGVYATVGADIGISMVKDGDLTADLAAYVGAGYGRMLDARSVAQAAAMCPDCDAAKLMGIAEVISKRGSYTAANEFDGAMNFANDLAKAAGSDNVFKLLQVLDSPIYNVGSRNVGYAIEAGLHVAKRLAGAEGTTDGMNMAVAQSLGWAMLLDDTSGVWVTQTFAMGMQNDLAAPISHLDGFNHPGDGNMAVGAQIGFNKDLSASSNILATVDISYDMPDGGDAVLGWLFHGEYNHAMGSKMVASVYTNVWNADHAGPAGSGDDAAVAALVEALAGALGGDGAAAPAAEEADDINYELGVNFTYYVF